MEGAEEVEAGPGVGGPAARGRPPPSRPSPRSAAGGRRQPVRWDSRAGLMRQCVEPWLRGVALGGVPGRNRGIARPPPPVRSCGQENASGDPGVAGGLLDLLSCPFFQHSLSRYLKKSTPPPPPTRACPAWETGAARHARQPYLGRTGGHTHTPSNHPSFQETHTHTHTPTQKSRDGRPSSPPVSPALH